jgi:hypothetical protein
MGAKGNALGVQELNFLQNRLGLGAGFDPDLFKHAAPQTQTLMTPEDEAALRAQLLGQFGGDQTAAGANQAQIGDIIQRMLGLQQTAGEQPQLANLDQASIAALNQIKQANQAALELQQTQQRDDLVNSLFGSGVEKSTIALDQAGRLNYGQGALQAQLLGDAGQRELALRNSISDRGLQSLGLQGSILGNAAGTAVNQGQLGTEQSRMRAQLLDSLFGRGLQRDLTNTEVTENERNRAFGQDQFRSNTLANLGTQTAGLQSQRTSPVSSILNGVLGAASFALPGGGTMGGALLSKIPGLSNILKPATKPVGGI